MNKMSTIFSASMIAYRVTKIVLLQKMSHDCIGIALKIEHVQLRRYCK